MQKVANLPSVGSTIVQDRGGSPFGLGRFTTLRFGDGVTLRDLGNGVLEIVVAGGGGGPTELALEADGVPVPGGPFSTLDLHGMKVEDETGGTAGITPAVVFDSAVAPLANIRSAREANQSPIDDNGVGITNLGSDTSGATVGATANYATISGGNQNIATASSATVGGGTQNNAGGSSSVVGGGAQNSATGTSSVVGGGAQNSATAAFSSVKGGTQNVASGIGATVSGGQQNTASGVNAEVASGFLNVASGENSHAEGAGCVASAFGSHAEGSNSTASGVLSHCEGSACVASGIQAHAEGGGTTASNQNSHAEGNNTIASGAVSHAEGNTTTASGLNSHAEGSNSIASAQNSRASGERGLATLYAESAHGFGLFGADPSQHISYGVGGEVSGNLVLSDASGGHLTLAEGQVAVLRATTAAIRSTVAEDADSAINELTVAVQSGALVVLANTQVKPFAGTSTINFAPVGFTLTAEYTSPVGETWRAMVVYDGALLGGGQ